MSKSNNNPIGLISGSTLKIIGCILIFVGVIITQLPLDKMIVNKKITDK